MASHAEKYFGRFQKSGSTYRIELHLDGFVGSATEIDNLMPNPVILRRRTSGKENTDAVVLGSELEFNFYSSNADAGQFDDIYTGAWKDWKVLYYRDSTLIWQGWMKPENLTREYITDQYELSIVATDGLADLKDIEFVNFSTGAVYTDRVTILTVVKRALEHLEIAIDFKIQLGTWETTLMTVAQNALFEMDVNTERFTSVIDGRTTQDNCLAVLEEVLRPFNVEMYQAEGFWYIQARNETNSPVFTHTYSTLAQSALSTIDNSLDITNYDFKNRGTLEILKPVKSQEITFKNYNNGSNLILNGDFSAATNWTATGWSSSTIGLEYFVGTSIDLLSKLKSDTFNIAAFPENSTITINFKVKVTALTPDDADYNPNIVCQLFSDATTEVISGGIKEYSLPNGTEYIDYKFTFPLKVTGSGYFVQFHFKPNGTNTYTSSTVQIDDVFSTINFEDADTVTYDSTLQVSNDDTVSTGVGEITILVGDSLRTNDFGAIQDGAVTNSIIWNRYGKTDGLALQTLIGLQETTRTSAYRNYLRLSIMDVDDNVRPFQRLKIDTTYYFIRSYSKNHYNWITDVDLEEIISTDPTYSLKLFQLTSKDGNVSTSTIAGAESANIDDSSTSLATTWSSTKIDSELGLIPIGDLLDVTVGAVANRQAIIYNDPMGYYENRLLIESDISDLGSYTADNVAETIASVWNFDAGAIPFKLKGGGVGNLSSIKMQYVDSAGTQLGYIGYPSTSNGKIIIFNDQNDSFEIYTNATLAATVAAGGNFTAVGTVQGTRLISTVAIGTAPLTVTSTTLVSNLNAHYLGGINSTGYMKNASANTVTAGGITMNDNIELRFGTLADESAIYSDGTDTIWSVDAGDIKINSGASSVKFWFDISTGDFHADGDVIANSTSISSDRELKDKEEDINNGLDIILKLKPKTFVFKKNPEQKRSGFIAQDVEEVLPEIVKDRVKIGDDKPYKDVNYNDTLAYMVSAIQELSKKVDSLENELKLCQKK